MLAMKQELLELASELERRPIVAIDIGTTKVSVVIARAYFDVDKYLSEGMITPNNMRLIIDGMGVTQSFGMSEGKIYNIAKVVNSIRRAFDQAKTQLGIDGNTNFQRVLFSVAGVDLKKEIISQSISFEDAGHIVTREDVRRLFNRAKNSAANSNDVIHVIPIEFVIKRGDSEISLKPIMDEVIGAFGDSLMGKFSLVSIDQRNVNTLEHAIRQIGLDPDEVVLQPLASTLATTTPSNHETGVLVIDIGGGTTDLLYMKDYRIVEVNSIEIAGNTVDNDIASILRLPRKDARKLKEAIGSLIISHKQKRSIEVKVEGIPKPIHIDVNNLIEIIKARYYELFSEDIPKILKSLLTNTKTGPHAGGEIPFVVLTGGGSNLDGLEMLAIQAFRDAEVPKIFRSDVYVTRRGPEMWIDSKTSTVRFPSNSDSTSLIYSTVVGMLVHYIREKVSDIVDYGQQEKQKEESTEQGIFQSIVQKIFKSFTNFGNENEEDQTF